MLTEVKLYGDLVDFGESWELDVHTPAEALRAIDANRRGFLNKIQDGSKYAFVLTQRGQSLTDEGTELETLDLERLELPMSNTQTLHILPVAAGDIETAFFVAVNLLVDVGIPTALAAVIVTAAIVVVLVGVSRLLMPAPPGMDVSQEGEESYYFSGPVNTSRQGACVPVLYGGPLLVGSQVIGQSLIAENAEGFVESKVLKSTAYAEVVDAISEGPIAGFAGADLESSVYLDGTPFKSGGEDLFEGFGVEFAEGTIDQNYWNLNATTNVGSTSVTPVGVWIRKATGGVIKTTTNPNIDQLKITVNTGRFARVNDKGDTKVIAVRLRFYIKGLGEPSFFEVGDLFIMGVATSSYYRTYSFDIDADAWGPPPYTMKLDRVTDDQDDDPSLSSQVYWTSWTEVVKSNCAFPLTAYAITRFDAEKFPSIPVRGYLMNGLLVKIPSNYNQNTRQYDGVWDGTFNASPQFTNNPAWIFYDLATNPRYGLGKYLTEDLIDKWALYSIAQYCDQLVDDGYGGTEPRFTCNLYLQTKKEAFSVLKELASSFRAIQFWADGQLRLHQDAPGTVHAVFAPANVVDGIFNYSGTPKHTRFTAALVTWINPEDNYSSWVEYVEDEAGIQLYGLNETSMTAVGCTSRSQAHRAGKYALLTSRLETDVVSFKTGLDAGTASPGKIIKVVDPLHNQNDESVAGRLASVESSTSVILDRPVTFEAGHTYHISFTLPDASRSAHQITNGAGTVTPPSVIAFTTTLSQTPVDGAMWDITDDAESERLYRVLSLTEAKGNSAEFYELSAVRYDEDTLLQADDPGKLIPPDEPPINPGLSSPSGLVLTEGVLPTGTTFRRYIDTTWLAPSTGVVERYEVEIVDPGAKTTKVTVNTTEYRVYDVVAGIYTITVRAINVAGQLSAGVSATITLDELAPIDLIYISGLELKGQGVDTNFTGPDAEFVWRLTSALTGEIGDETFGGDTGIPDPWFRDYEVTVYDEDGNVLRIDYTYDRQYTYTLGKNLDDGGPNRTFEIGVAARDIFNRTTDQEFLEVTNPPPVDYTNISVATGLEMFIVSLTPPPDPDFVGTRVYVSQQTGFTPDSTNMAYQGDDRVISINNLPEQYYYFRLEGVDEFGPAGIYTSELQVILTSVDRIRNQIAGEIQQGWLYQDLSDKIDLTEENSENLSLLATVVSYKITTYRQPSQPNSPNTGDMWYRTDQNNQPYRFNGSTGLWESVQDTTSTGTTSYVGAGQPTDDPVTYSTGDVYYDSADTFHPYRFDGAVWVSIRDTAATGVKTYYLPSAPTSGMAEGDLWFETDEGNRIHRYTSGVWVAVTDENAGNSTYFGTVIPPNNPATYTDGDLFFDQDDGNRPYRFNGSTWQDIRDQTTGNTTYTGSGDPVDGPPYIPGDLYFDVDRLNYPWRYDITEQWEEIADGTNTGMSTWYQDNPPLPPGDTVSIGDLWFDTNANNKVYRYNGSVDEWVPVTDESVVQGVTPYIQPNQPQPPGLVPGDLWIDTDDDDKAYEWDGDSWNELNENNVTITAATAVERMARVDADNIGYAEYTMKVDVNGHIAGIGLGVSGGASGPIRSQIIMLADQFAIGFPTHEWLPNHVYEVGQWVTPTQAWINANGYPELQPDGETLYKWDYVYEVTAITGGAATSSIESAWWPTEGVSNWNGNVRFTCRDITATLPFVTGPVPLNPHSNDPGQQTTQGIIISNAAIGHLTVDTAHIAELAVTNGKIVDLDVGKLTTGTIDVGSSGYIRLGSPNFELTSNTRRLTVRDDQPIPVSRVELGGLSTGGYGIVIRNTAGQVMLRSGSSDYIDGTYIADATIETAKIENSLHSSNWTGPGGAGFELKVNGAGSGSATFNELSIYNNLGELLLHSGSSQGDFAKAGSGVNIVPGQYANFEDPSIPFSNVANADVFIDTTFGYFQGSSLKFDSINSNHCTAACTSSYSADGANIRLTPGKKWIVSFWAYQTSFKQINVYFSTGTNDYGGSVSGLGSTYTWVRVSRVIDMTAQTSITDVFMYFYLFHTSSANNTWIDGLMVEEQIGSGTYPSAYYGPAAEGADQSGGANMVFNSQMYPYTSGWGYSESTVPVAAEWGVLDRDITNASYYFIHPGLVQIHQTSGTQGGEAFLYSLLIAIDSSKRYQVGGLSAAHHCTTNFGAAFYDINKGWLANVYCEANASAKWGSLKIEDYYQHNRFIEPSEIPADAAFARVVCWKYPTTPGETYSYGFFTHAHFCEVKYAQTVFTPYSPSIDAISVENPIGPNNNTTYILDAAIGTAQIDNLAVDFGNIKDLAVGTIKIQNYSVTVSNTHNMPNPIRVNGSFETLFTIPAIDTSGMIYVGFNVKCSGTITSGSGYFQIFIYRNADGAGWSLYSEPWSNDTVGTHTFSFTTYVIDTAPLGGSQTYRVVSSSDDDLIVDLLQVWHIGSLK